MILGGTAESYEELYENAKNALQTPSDAQKTALTYGGLLEKPLQKTIVFECEDQKSFRGIPFRFLKACYGQEEFKDYKFLWCIKKDANADEIQTSFKDITIIKGKGAKYKEALATSKIIISDTRLPYYYLTREGQIYIRSFAENLYAEDIEYDINDTLDQKRMQIKDLLNATHIISRDQVMTDKYLKKGYQLQSVYTGKILEAGNQKEMNLKKILTNVVRQQDTQDIIDCKDSKKSLLIYADYTKNEWWQKRVHRVLDHIDLEDYDVTILTPVVRDSEAIKSLENLNDQIRILMRSGHMNATMDDYLIYHCVREEYLGFDQYDALIDQISKESIENEWKRLVGNTHFDAVLFCDNLTQEQMGFWHMLIRRSDIKKKYMVSWENFRQEYQRMQSDPKIKDAVEHYLKNCEAYDKLYLIAGDEMRYVKDIFGVKTELDVLKDQLPAAFTKDYDARPKYCEYQQDDYLIIDQQEDQDQLTITIIKEPASKEYNCITNLVNYSKDSFTNVLDHFVKIQKSHEEAKLYLLDSIEYMSEWADTEIRDRKLEDKVYKVCKVDLNKEYLSKFDAYLVSDIRDMKEDIYLDEARKLDLNIVE